MTRSASVLLLAVLLIPALAGAQGGGGAKTELHKGFWIGFGIGGGYNFSDFAQDVRLGGGGYLRMGGTLNRRILLGGEVSGWGRDIGGSTFGESGATAIVLFYPSGRGLFLKGGAGFAGWSTSTSVGSTTTRTTGSGFAATASVGYDLQIGGNLFLTPNLDFLYHTLSSDNAAWANISAGTVLLFTLGLTWH